MGPPGAGAGRRIRPEAGPADARSGGGVRTALRLRGDPAEPGATAALRRGEHRSQEPLPHPAHVHPIVPASPSRSPLLPPRPIVVVVASAVSAPPVAPPAAVAVAVAFTIAIALGRGCVGVHRLALGSPPLNPPKLREHALHERPRLCAGVHTCA